ncbi:MAG: hypothetical protein ACK5MT_08675 [Actinomycetales bacterium]
MQKMSSAEKKARTVAPTVPAPERQAVARKAMGRVSAKASVTRERALKPTKPRTSNPHRAA